MPAVGPRRVPDELAPPPPPTPTRALDVARMYWARAEHDALPSRSTPVIVEQVLTHLEAGLRRWIGAEGYAVVLARAVEATIDAHPALAGIADLDAPASSAALVAPARRILVVDSDASRQAVIALLVAVMQHLGDLIGADMAVRLMAVSGRHYQPREGQRPPLHRSP